MNLRSHESCRTLTLIPLSLPRGRRSVCKRRLTAYVCNVLNAQLRLILSEEVQYKHRDIGPRERRVICAKAKVAKG